MAIETLPNRMKGKAPTWKGKAREKKRGEEQHPTKRQHPSPQKHKLGLQKSNLGPKPTQTEDGNSIVQNQQELLLCNKMICRWVFPVLKTLAKSNIEQVWPSRSVRQSISKGPRSHTLSFINSRAL